MARVGRTAGFDEPTVKVCLDSYAIAVPICFIESTIDSVVDGILCYEDVVNGGFETGDLTGWEVESGTWAVVTSPAAYSGTYCLQSQSVTGSILSSPICVPDAPFEEINAIVTLWSIINTGFNAPAGIDVIFYASDGSYLEETEGLEVGGGDGVWEQQTTIATGGHTTRGGYIRIRLHYTFQSDRFPVEIGGEFDAITVLFNYSV